MRGGLYFSFYQKSVFLKHPNIYVYIGVHICTIQNITQETGYFRDGVITGPMPSFVIYICATMSFEIGKINKDMQLILYSPALWVIHTDFCPRSFHLGHAT